MVLPSAVHAATLTITPVNQWDVVEENPERDWREPDERQELVARALARKYMVEKFNHERWLMKQDFVHATAWLMFVAHAILEVVRYTDFFPGLVAIVLFPFVSGLFFCLCVIIRSSADRGMKIPISGGLLTLNTLTLLMILEEIIRVAEWNSVVIIITNIAMMYILMRARQTSGTQELRDAQWAELV